VRDIVCGWIRKEDKVLLVNRLHEPWKGYYGPPGGGLEQGEDLKDAVAREVGEETGLKVDVKEKIATFIVKYKSFRRLRCTFSDAMWSVAS